jgi:type II secretory pathway component PulK
MRPRSDRGAATILLLALLVLAAAVVAVAATHWHRASSRAQWRLERESALAMARGGVRLAAERLARGEGAALERRDGGASLRVTAEGETILAECEWPTLTGMPVRVEVRAAWRGGALVDWRER